MVTINEYALLAKVNRATIYLRIKAGEIVPMLHRARHRAIFMIDIETYPPASYGARKRGIRKGANLA